MPQLLCNLCNRHSEIPLTGIFRGVRIVSGAHILLILRHSIVLSLQYAPEDCQYSRTTQAACLEFLWRDVVREYWAFPLTLQRRCNSQFAIRNPRNAGAAWTVSHPIIIYRIHKLSDLRPRRALTAWGFYCISSRPAAQLDSKLRQGIVPTHAAIE